VTQRRSIEITNRTETFTKALHQKLKIILMMNLKLMTTSMIFHPPESQVPNLIKIKDQHMNNNKTDDHLPVKIGRLNVDPRKINTLNQKNINSVRLLKGILLKIIIIIDRITLNPDNEMIIINSIINNPNNNKELPQGLQIQMDLNPKILPYLKRNE
jgi:hypothetical protein